MTSESITELLIAYGHGTPGAFGRLVELLHPELRRVARQQLAARGRPDPPILETTALVHEAYFKLVDGTRVTWRDRGHFLAIAAHAMRQVIVDHARSRKSVKRGDGAPHQSIEPWHAAVEADAERVLVVNQVLDRLGAEDHRLLQIVECRFFAGYTDDETAEALEVSTRTVEREWRRARTLLQEAIAVRS